MTRTVRLIGYSGDMHATAPFTESTAEQLYRAYETRDARFDGRFFVGVKTTGIFCRPICPARTPLRRNVAFYSSAAAAFAAGLRPCLRCRPERAPVLRAFAGGEALVARALQAIDAGALNDGPLEALALRIGVTPRHLRRLFDTHLGATPVQVAQMRRLLFAKQLIEESGLPLADVAFAAGFNSVRRFNAAFRQGYGRVPGDLRRTRSELPQGSGVEIRLNGIAREGFEGLLDFYRLRAFAGVESVDTGAYARLLRLESAAGTVIGTLVLRGESDGLQLQCHLTDLSHLTGVVARVKRMFDLDAPMAAVQAHLRRDRLLRPALQAVQLRVPCAWDPWELAVRAVLGQQISVKGAATLASRLVARFGTLHEGGRTEGQGGLTHLFPLPSTLADAAPAALQAIGLTRGRTATLGTLARYVASRPEWSTRYPGIDAFVQDLTTLPGIGPWTAHYVAMRGFSDPDAFPAADLGLLKAARALGIATTAKQLDAHAEHWRPWRAYAAQALWNFLPKDAA